MTVLAEVIDPDGRRVELTTERWQHILESVESSYRNRGNSFRHGVR